MSFYLQTEHTNVSRFGSKLSLTSSKWKGPWGPTTTGWGEASRVIGFFIGMGMVGFCFGIRAILAIKMVNSLEELISRK